MKKKDVFWGLLFIIAAILIILNQFGFLAGVSMFDLVATIVLAGIISRSVLHLNFWGIMFPAALICIIYADQWNITKFTPWPALLTALLLSIGLSILFKRYNYLGWNFNHDHNSFSNNIINNKDSNVVECSTNFGECSKYINTDNFEKANINCSFGEVKVYFDNALIPSGKAVINMSISFGEVYLYIPRTWNVVNELHALFGDVSRGNNERKEDAPVVIIKGNINFGEANIIYV